MRYSGVVTRKGQVTIPAEIRRELEIKEGDRIVFFRDNGRLILSPAESVSIVAATAGIFADAVPNPPLTRQQEKDAFAQAVADEVMESMSRER